MKATPSRRRAPAARDDEQELPPELRALIDEQLLADFEAGDKLAGLELVEGALSKIITSKRPVMPKAVVRWLALGLAEYGAPTMPGGEGPMKSLDECLGLKNGARGKGAPRLRARAQLERALVNDAMHKLLYVGATVGEAAMLVASTSKTQSKATVRYLWERGGGRSLLDKMKKRFPLTPDRIDGVLADYPDEPEALRRAKDCIRQRYVPRGTVVHRIR